jgi:hypothetical protein
VRDVDRCPLYLGAGHRQCRLKGSRMAGTGRT